MERRIADRTQKLANVWPMEKHSTVNSCKRWGRLKKSNRCYEEAAREFHASYIE
ncbi:MAG: hypothetical protein GY721_10160 [Deltaproteobacteria bacterium]|nr:hypothetical protein [Deltaproteobacteria bacterium]